METLDHESTSEYQPDNTEDQQFISDDALPVLTFMEFSDRMEELGATEHVRDLIYFARDIFTQTGLPYEFDSFIDISLKTSQSPLFTDPEVLAVTMAQDLETRIERLYPGFLDLLADMNAGETE